MTRYVLISLLFSFALLLSSCATNTLKQNQGVDNKAKGAKPATDQIIGHRVEAGIDDKAQGTLISYLVTNAMDSYDRQTLNHVYERSVSGTTSAWINPDTANRYSVVPESAYANPQQNTYCRRAAIQAIVDGREHTTTSTACRNKSGQWQLQ